MAARSARSRLASVLVLAVAAPALAALPAGPAAAADERPTYLGKTHYTGEFHAHTSISDGVKMPRDAFEHVASRSDADFFTVSDHDVLFDRRNSDDFTTDWRDAVSDEWRHLHEASASFNAAQDELVTIPAEEITWYDDSGHINLFNTDWLTTARSEGDSLSFGAATGDLKYDLPTFYARLKQDPDAIAQFNHPDPDGKGNFAAFGHLDREVDERMQLIEVKNATNLAQYQLALDAGWHLAPVWNGDEHSANWVTGNESTTGVWAEQKSQNAAYQAMRDRSMYSTQDVDTVLTYSGNGQMMGSVLASGTSSVTLDVGLTDPGSGESFTSVRVLTNGGAVAHEVPGVSGGDVNVTHELDADDGDFFYVVATQADGDTVVSAPVWVGGTTRGADYAPTITLGSDLPSAVAYGDRVALPDVVAEDDSGAQPTVRYQVWDDNGQVPVTDEGFRVRSYSDHFVVMKATDGAGNVGSRMLRLTVTQDDADPAGVFGYLGSVATVGEEPGTAGLSVTTDATVDRVYAQVRRAGHRTWRSTPVLTSADDTTYEINTVGKPGEVYQNTVTGQPLRSHEFDLTGLRDGTRYEYRFGVAVDGAAPGPREPAWTDVRGSFLAGGERNRPIYLLGDLAADSREPADLRLLPDMLARLRAERPGGGTVVQTGDLVARGVQREYWADAFDHVLDGLGLQVAPVAGDAESDGDLEYNILSPRRNAIFSSMYALPDDGPIGESNYSFDRGDVHVAVLNTNYDLDAQLDWLVDDIRAADEPWNVVVGHRSFFGGAGAEGPGMRAKREKVLRPVPAARHRPVRRRTRQRVQALHDRRRPPRADTGRGRGGDHLRDARLGRAALRRQCREAVGRRRRRREHPDGQRAAGERRPAVAGDVHGRRPARRRHHARPSARRLDGQYGGDHRRRPRRRRAGQPPGQRRRRDGRGGELRRHRSAGSRPARHRGRARPPRRRAVGRLRHPVARRRQRHGEAALLGRPAAGRGTAAGARAAGRAQRQRQCRRPVPHRLRRRPRQGEARPGRALPPHHRPRPGRPGRPQDRRGPAFHR
ncbi:CehA/McbA family metallohydrolase [Haloactinopolyspora alba]|uniref:CehA/McbA family metallohydrolase n=1 Tax=Haloactinopolyspora alba TaxID=648780 RepID=UPI00101BA9B5|nr:CehA/McbA family metallohydrolase [Haloactinopolyspora alba]